MTWGGATTNDSNHRTRCSTSFGEFVEFIIRSCVTNGWLADGTIKSARLGSPVYVETVAVAVIHAVNLTLQFISNISMNSDNDRLEGTVVERLQTFLRDYYRDELGRFIQNYPNDQTSLEIDFHDLFRFEPSMADDLREHPEVFIERLEEALRTYDFPVDIDPTEGRVRVINLPETETFTVGAYRSEHIGSYIAVSGQVTKRTEVKPKIDEAHFVCQRCGTKESIPQGRGKTTFREPHECSGCERQGPFKVDFKKSEFIDHQNLRMQQPPEETKGADGTFVDVELENDLVNSVTPGARATINGILELEQGGNAQEKDAVFEQYVRGYGVEIEETDYEDIDVSDHLEEIRELADSENPYEVVRESIAPTITGDKQATIKDAIALQFFGGVRSEKPNGTVVRGDSHILILGDPGTAKSALLRAAENIAPRSTFISGKGVTKAGMTAAAVPDDFGESKWSLEAGALVLANNGLACVDEIDKVQEDALSSLHDALEAPQQVPIHKAGINSTLPSQTSLLAAGNPKHGRFDTYESVPPQFDLDSALLSRFDLIFTLEDEPDKDLDASIAESIIRGRQLAHRFDDGEQLTEDEQAEIQPQVDEEVLRAWVAHARQSVRPTIPKPIQESLKDAYTTFRNEVNNTDEDGVDPIPLTARKIEGMQRLAEASARLRLSDTVNEADVDRAMSLIRASLEDVGKDPNTGEYDADLVETGESKAQRERKKAVQEEIQRRGREADEKGVFVEAVLDILEGEGHPRERCRHDIESWAESGELMKWDTEVGEKVEWVR